MKFSALAITALVSMTNATEFSELTQCTQSTESSDYGNSRSVCDSTDNDCCAVFYELYDSSSVLSQPYCISET